MIPAELETRINALEDIKVIKSMNKEFVFLLMNSKFEDMLHCL